MERCTPTLCRPMSEKKASSCGMRASSTANSTYSMRSTSGSGGRIVPLYSSDCRYSRLRKPSCAMRFAGAARNSSLKTSRLSVPV